MERNRQILIFGTVIVLVLGLVGLGLWQFYQPPASRKVPIGQVAPMPQPTVVNADVANNMKPLDLSPNNTGLETNKDQNPTSINNNQEVVIVYGGNATYSDTQGKVVTVGPLSGTNQTQASDGQKSAAAAVLENKPDGINSVNNDKTQSTEVPVKKENELKGNDVKDTKKAASNNSNTTQAQSTVKTTVVKTNSTTKTLPGNDYWIQVLSSPNRDRVEVLKQDLVNRGWSGRITTKDVNGIEYYRLRFGPFAESAEAQKFLAYVQQVKGLEGSYVVQDKSK